MSKNLWGELQIFLTVSKTMWGELQIFHPESKRCEVY